MALNRDDFTDEQWAELQAEIDRERTKASTTAHKNAEKSAAEKLRAEVEAAVEAERERLKMDEAERLEADRKAIEESRAALAAERKSIAATKKLASAGLPEDKINDLLPMFTAVDDKALDATLDVFINTYKDVVKAQVDSARQELLNNATPPNQPTNAPIGQDAAIQEAISAGNEVAAVDMLLSAAGYTPQ